MKKCKGIVSLLLAVLLFTSAMLPGRAVYAETDQERIQRLERELEDARKSGDERYDSLLKQYNRLLEEQKEKKANPRVNFKTDFRSVKADSEATIKVSVQNTSGVNFRNGAITFSTLPAGMTLKNTSSTLAKVGELLGGQEKSAEFQVKIDKEVKTGNYPIGFTWSGSHGEVSEQEFSFSQTFYIEITNTQEKKEPAQLSITNISIPKAAAMNQDFLLSFTVTNTGKSKAEELRVSVEPSGSIINKSRNVFVEASLGPGASKKYQVTLYAPGSGSSEEKVDDKNYPIKITAESSGTASSENAQKGSGPASVSQYADILIVGNKKGSEDIGVKSPQLMVENYSYGGGSVEAGKNFTLSLTMVNTSKEKKLRNIKVTLTAEEGTFIPYNTSNSFYIDSLEAGGRTTKEITFSTKPDAKAQTIALNLDSAYEDMKGNALSAKDVISIPVVQVTKLDIDDPVMPPEAYVGQPVPVSFSFYNTGKNILRNLKITAEGNFDTQGSTSYFAGNMDPGKSDSYDLQLMPREVGKVSGTVTFAYEDVQGQIQTIEKTFEMTAMEMPMMEEEMMPEMPPEKDHKKTYMIGGAVAAVVVIALLIWRKRRKKRKEREMDIDE